MSGFVGAALAVGRIMPSDDSLVDMPDTDAAYAQPPWHLAARGQVLPAYSTPWWPGRRAFFDDGANGLADYTRGPDDYYPTSGSNGRLAFVGYTRDAYGSPVGGCTVRCFRTSTVELTETVTSDPTTGFYQVTTPHADGHFVIVHKSGSPAIAGASIDTITPA